MSMRVGNDNAPSWLGTNEDALLIICIKLILSVFKYLAEKYLQRLKQQTAEETEVIHSTSNKIGTHLFLNATF